MYSPNLKTKFRGNHLYFNKICCIYFKKLVTGNMNIMYSVNEEY